jgi:probable F420-dependent oxidoreductase
MHVGVTFPHAVLGGDQVAIRDWAQAAEDLGFDHVAIYEHVIGPDPSRHPQQTFRFTNRTVWHEPLVLCGFLAGVTQRIGLKTTVVVLPLRETVALAKQAAEVDVLSGGRLRLGVGVGWMDFEFAALGRDFHSRGARLDEQIALLRALWTEPAVTFHGRWHTIDGAGINPLPLQRPIPVWIGGLVRAAARRSARHGDGWIVTGRYLTSPPDDAARQMLNWLHEEARAAGRPPSALGVQGGLGIAGLSEAEWVARAEAWREFGATALLVDTGELHGRPVPTTVDQEIKVLRHIGQTLEAVVRPT